MPIIGSFRSLTGSFMPSQGSFGSLPTPQGFCVNVPSHGVFRALVGSLSGPFGSGVAQAFLALAPTVQYSDQWGRHCLGEQ